jgi:hypothetical protein
MRVALVPQAAQATTLASPNGEKTGVPGAIRGRRVSEVWKKWIIICRGSAGVVAG